ncbi:hypothetical protein J8J40_27550, partial [Mycobacterium tuberculosis]|nr:hypothetical protein [Mycobacterium tuberculosis]
MDTSTPRTTRRTRKPAAAAATRTQAVVAERVDDLRDVGEPVIRPAAPAVPTGGDRYINRELSW